MAASKIHLQNVDKSYKLEPTDRKTDAGRIIYKNTKTGELHSEISVTLEHPEGSGNWINVPSLINGRVYNTKGVLAMLKAGKVTPNSTGHASEDIAVEAAIYRSNNLQQLPATTEDIVGADIKPEKVVSLSDAVNSWNSSGVQDVKNYERPAEFEVDIRDEDMMRKFDNATQYSPSSFQNLPDLSNIENLTVSGAPGSPLDVNTRMGQAMSSYGPRTGPSPIPEDAVMTYADGRAYNGAIQMINGKPHDAAGQELVVNDAGTVPVDDTNQAMLAKVAEEKAIEAATNTDNRSFGEKFTNAMTRAAGVAEMSYPGPSQAEIEAKRQNDLIDERANASDKAAAMAADKAAQLARIQGNLNPIIEQIEEAKAKEAAKQTTRDRQSFRQPGPHIGEQPIKSYLGKSWESPVIGPHIGEEVIKPTTPDKKSEFKYKKHMTPEEKMNAGKNLTGLTPNYGKMPGFKFNQAKGQKAGKGYWDADEKSGFWKTDAGYEKAKQTWGRDGGPLPNWVRKPKRKELDVDKILKMFS